MALATLGGGVEHFALEIAPEPLHPWILAAWHRVQVLNHGVNPEHELAIGAAFPASAVTGGERLIGLGAAERAKQALAVDPDLVPVVLDLQRHAAEAVESPLFARPELASHPEHEIVDPSNAHPGHGQRDEAEEQGKGQQQAQPDPEPVQETQNRGDDTGDKEGSGDDAAHGAAPFSAVFVRWIAGIALSSRFSGGIVDEAGMAYTVFVDGLEGTTGLRINDYLARRPDIEVLRIAPDKRKDLAERARLLNASDVAFLCLPDSAAREAAALVSNPRTCLIDASTAHRTAPGWVFGLPELAPGQRDALRETKRIANPGCHASAFILMLRPLVDAGLVPATAALSATSITGYSGGGKKMIEQYQTPNEPALTSPRPYALKMSHKHLPEMTVHSGLTTQPIFMPIVGNFYKGLAVSVPLPLSALGTTAEAVHRAYAARYVGEPFVRVMPLRDPDVLETGFFDVQACNDSNRVEIFVFANDSQAILMARLDNLGKGASGAAVQAMNIHLGVDESLGL